MKNDRFTKRLFSKRCLLLKQLLNKAQHFADWSGRMFFSRGKRASWSGNQTIYSKSNNVFEKSLPKKEEVYC
ncbi:hypothetical protein AB986_08595 [Alkalihalobacillus macyae]|uniref:Uncharacterized protein n=1 Tax=Guptibacillus hwajinpoensis TaxID=208199 RepID=A0A0J6D4L9_9BACL|nr:hypothetical protein AB986_08595 [Alkalihalobacillus macyae]